MKFQNPSFIFFFNGRTNAQTHKPKAICSPLFQSWGHKHLFPHYESMALWGYFLDVQGQTTPYFAVPSDRNLNSF